MSALVLVCVVVPILAAALILAGAFLWLRYMKVEREPVDKITKIDSNFLETPADFKETTEAAFNKHEYEEQERKFTAVNSELIPQYWSNKTDDDGKFSQMLYTHWHSREDFSTLLQETYQALCSSDRPCPKPQLLKCQRTPGGCPCNQPGGRPGLPREYRIRRVIRVEDSTMWAKYVAKRFKVHEECSADPGVSPQVLTSSAVEKCPRVFEPLDSTEAYLWHGTSVRSALHIAREGFDLSKSTFQKLADKYRDYGQGIYLSESCTHSDEYAKEEHGGFYRGIYALLLCRVCLGKVHFTREKVNSALAKKMADAGCHSICSDHHPDQNPFRDFVVYDTDRVYCEYLILYSREPPTYPLEDPTNNTDIYNMPFFLELPVYWRHVAKDPRKELFSRKYVVQQKTREIMQRLVAATSVKEPPTLVKVWRVENSKTWNEYEAFKDSVRRRLGRALESMENSQTYSRGHKLSQNQRASFQTAKTLDSFGDLLVNGVLEKLAEVDPEAEMSFENIEDNIGEHLLWHGTNKQAARGIARDNFRVPPFRGGANGARFGQGIYLAESFNKAVSYAANESGKKYVLLCRVCVGEMHFVTASCQPLAHLECRKQGKDSVLAHPQKRGVREFVALDAQQVYPEFILKFDVTQRQSQSLPLPGNLEESRLTGVESETVMGHVQSCPVPTMGRQTS